MSSAGKGIDRCQERADQYVADRNTKAFKSRLDGSEKGSNMTYAWPKFQGTALSTYLVMLRQGRGWLTSIPFVWDGATEIHLRGALPEDV